MWYFTFLGKYEESFLSTMPSSKSRPFLPLCLHKLSVFINLIYFLLAMSWARKISWYREVWIVRYKWMSNDSIFLESDLWLVNSPLTFAPRQSPQESFSWTMDNIHLGHWLGRGSEEWSLTSLVIPLSISFSWFNHPFESVFP